MSVGDTTGGSANVETLVCICGSSIVGGLIVCAMCGGTSGSNGGIVGIVGGNGGNGMGGVSSSMLYVTGTGGITYSCGALASIILYTRCGIDGECVQLLAICSNNTCFFLLLRVSCIWPITVALKFGGYVL